MNEVNGQGGHPKTEDLQPNVLIFTHLLTMEVLMEHRIKEFGQSVEI